MIVSRTYNTTAGLNYIQDTDLAFATIYVVERDGTQHDPYLPGMLVNRTFIHNTSDGKINFPITFDPGTEIFVMFKPVSGVPGPPVGVCVAGAIIPITLPDAIVGVPYSQTILLTGTAPFTISGVTLPAGLSISNSGNSILISGTPTTEAFSLIEFDVNNCAASVALFNQAINVFAATTNFYVSNMSTAGVQINSVSGISFAIQTGSLPATYLTGITGVHTSYTGTVALNITGLVFPQTLTLSKNSVILETLFPTVDGDYVFGSQTFLSTDEFLIILN